MTFDETLLTISNGHLYDSNEMARVGCHDCAGCSDCCRGMGDTILVDPYDVNRLSKALGKTFDELLLNEIELHVEDGLILPNLKMKGKPLMATSDAGDSEGACAFLNAEGRCSIHAARPGICRLFPLGRQYTEDSIRYFVLNSECPVKNKTKVKIEKWLDTPRLKEYESFLIAWHAMTKQLRAELSESGDETYQKQVSTMFIQLFFQKPYGDDFFTEFYQRRDLLV